MPVRVVWNGRTGEIEGVSIWNANTQTYVSVRPTGRLAAEVRQAFADFVAESIVDAVWPAPSAGMKPPASSGELLSAAEELLDPRLLAAHLVGAIVQVAALHAGIPLPVARVMGKAAKDLFHALSEPDPDAPKVQAVQYLDLTLSAEDGSLINSPALPEIAAGETADVINKLLSPGAPKSPSSTRPAGAIAPPAGPPRTPGRSAGASAISPPTSPTEPPAAKPGNEPGSHPQSPPAPHPLPRPRPPGPSLGV